MTTPQDPAGPQQEPAPHARRADQPNFFVGVVLIVLGFLFLLNNILPDFDFGDYWPVVLIVTGIVFLMRSRNRER